MLFINQETFQNELLQVERSQLSQKQDCVLQSFEQHIVQFLYPESQENGKVQLNTVNKLIPLILMASQLIQLKDNKVGNNMEKDFQMDIEVYENYTKLSQDFDLMSNRESEINQRSVILYIQDGILREFIIASFAFLS
ncbi:hypothetical protein TTHERM_00886920 (macronuclear) [Tetrahymena thermophila SB210]|uniref:Uncharacterized protein n=1 Tax=Tetrahymena thermophila (strain SB210) TaxID=312017 RepID=Q239Y6_TETTS|nr:hypothetical protein TTHERM_00886920 [Tetrahymena thermophila SB210]EAR93377.1 hypothetical protein TTHERM_00886920 [Tetrahymena thermophila SB210]|eukprot:XP_001013622.1 hypothetical protein TTHERM_00886920 [Tetrahymena thermophila SB210]